MTGEGTQGIAVGQASSLRDSPGVQGVRRSRQTLSKILPAVLRPNLPPMLPTLLPAIVIRLLFIAFTISTIKQVVDLQNDPSYWSLSTFCVLPQIAELCIFILPFLLTQRFPWAAGRFNGICIFIFLLSAFTPVWITELYFLSIVRYRDWAEDPLYANVRIMEITDENHKNMGECRGCDNYMIFRQTWITKETLPFYRVTHGYMFLAIFAQCMLSPGGFNSDQLIIKICNAADIIELVAYLEDKSTHWTVYLKKVILYIWHISLLQFGFIPTSADAFSSSSIRVPQQRPTRIQGNQHNDLPQPGVADTNEEGTTKKPRKKKNAKKKQRDESNALPEADAEAYAETVQAEASVQGESSTQAEASVQARRDCGCHFYFFKGVLGEILVSIMLQDVPFLILRFTMYFKFNMHSLQAVCFTIKNIMFLVLHIVQATSLLRKFCCNRQRAEKVAN